MANDELYEQFAYVTYDDIKNMNEDKENTLLAIRAPPGTKLEIPEMETKEGKGEDKNEEEKEGKTMKAPLGKGNDKGVHKERGIQTAENKKYQIMLNSGGEEIMVYLISNEEDKSEEDQDNEFDPEEEAEGEGQGMAQDAFANIDKALKNEESVYDSGQEKNKEPEELESISVLFQ